MPQNEPPAVAVVGSRTFRNLERVTAYVNALPPETVVVSGGARGVDQTAEYAAAARGMTVCVVTPDWKRHGRRAGIIRNGDIERRSARVAAFWDGRSPGTADTIRRFRRAGKPVEIIPDEPAGPAPYETPSPGWE